MKLSRRAKKLLKGYLGWKGARRLGPYGAVFSVGYGAYQFWKRRKASQSLGHQDLSAQPG